MTELLLFYYISENIKFIINIILTKNDDNLIKFAKITFIILKFIYYLLTLNNMI